MLPALLFGLALAGEPPRLSLALPHSYSAEVAARSPDGRLLLTVAPDSAILYDAATQAALYRRTFDGSSELCAGFLGDGERYWILLETSLSWWDTATGEQLKAVEVGERTYCEAVSSDGGRIAIRHTDADALTLWDLDSGAQLAVLRTGEKGDTFSFSDDLAFRANGEVVLAGDEEAVARYKDDTLLESRPLQDLIIALSQDGELLVTRDIFGANDEWLKVPNYPGVDHLRVHAVEGGALVAEVPLSEPELDGVSLAPGGRSMLIKYDSGARYLVDLRRPDRPRRLEAPTALTSRPSYSPDGRHLALIDEDGFAWIWELPDGASGRRLTLPDDYWQPHEAVEQAVFSADSAHLYTLHSSLSNTDVIDWPLDGGDPLLFGPQVSPASAMAVSPAGDRFVFSAFGGVPQLWAPLLWPNPRWLHATEYNTAALAFTASGGAVAQSSGGALILWEAATGQLRGGVQTEHEQLIGHIGLSDDLQILVSASKDRAQAIQTRAGLPFLHRTSDSEWIGAAQVSPDGRAVVIANKWTLEVWSAASGFLLETLEQPHGAIVEDLRFSPNSRRLVSYSPMGQGAAVWDTATWAPLLHLPGFDGTDRHEGLVDDLLLSPNGDAALVLYEYDDPPLLLHDLVSGESRAFAAGPDTIGSQLFAFSGSGALVLTDGPDNTAILWDAATGTPRRRLEGHGSYIQHAGFLCDDSRVVTFGDDGTVRLWDTASGALLATLVDLYLSGNWLVVDPDGRFDTADLAAVDGAWWIRPEDPLRALPVESYARSHFHPGLLQDVLLGRPLPPIPDLSTLNVLTPQVTLQVQQRGAEARVTLRACGRAEGALSSGVRDLRLSRGGQLVAQWPGELVAEAGCVTQRTRVQLPTAGAEILFSAYAFNRDGVKGPDSEAALRRDAPDQADGGRTYLVQVGVDDYAGQRYDLAYAASDASALSRALTQALGGRGALVPVLLTSGADVKAPEGAITGAATAENLRAVLARLAGEGTDVDLEGLERLAAATPDDTVILSFSGHGYADDQGSFHLMMDDRARGADAEGDLDAALGWAVSEGDLSDWLRPVDAGTAALIIDACQSAASVEGRDGFKPGPLGSRGFGQLAYDKGMVVLAASQSDAVALEHQRLKHGLLTWALVIDGLQWRGADLAPADGIITLYEWLSYAEQRVPQLARILVDQSAWRGAGALPVGVVRDGDGWSSARSVALRPDAQPPQVTQQPRLYSYARQGALILWEAEAPAE